MYRDPSSTPLKIRIHTSSTCHGHPKGTEKLMKPGLSSVCVRSSVQARQCGSAAYMRTIIMGTSTPNQANPRSQAATRPRFSPDAVPGGDEAGGATNNLGTAAQPAPQAIRRVAAGRDRSRHARTLTSRRECVGSVHRPYHRHRAVRTRTTKARRLLGDETKSLSSVDTVTYDYATSPMAHRKELPVRTGLVNSYRLRQNRKLTGRGLSRRYHRYRPLVTAES